MVSQTKPLIGVLALQGDVREHAAMLEAAGARTRKVRTPAQLEQLDGLVIPGGESSVIDKLARLFDVHSAISDYIRRGLPVLGTCAGLIMLAERVEDGIEGQQTFGGLDVTVRRNAFGTQVDSFETDLTVRDLPASPLRAVFIRAPIVVECGDEVKVTAQLDDGTIVGVRQGRRYGYSFHPELTDDHRLHSQFVAFCNLTQFSLNR